MVILVLTLLSSNCRRSNSQPNIGETLADQLVDVQSPSLGLYQGDFEHPPATFDVISTFLAACGVLFEAPDNIKASADPIGRGVATVALKATWSASSATAVEVVIKQRASETEHSMATDLALLREAGCLAQFDHE